MAAIDSDLVLKRWKPTDTTRPPGRYAVKCEGARGLYARLFDTGAITWVFRYKYLDKQRQMALGPYPAVSLASARDMAREAYAHAKAGRDPAAVRATEDEAAKEHAARQVTFETYATAYMADRRETFKSPKQGKLWEATLRDHAFPHIGSKLVNEITEQDIQAMLAPIYNTKRETAVRVLQRVGDIMGAAIDDGTRDKDRQNPTRRDAHAHWRKQRNRTRKGTAGRRGKQPAVPVADVAEWFAVLRGKQGMGARALEFLALTGTRSGEVRAATWQDIDLQQRVWTVPVENSKMSLDPNRQPHRVPLSDAAVQILESIDRREGVDLVFPAPRDGALSDMTISKVMRDMQAAEIKAGRAGWLDVATDRPAVPHGLRATFRTWAAERGGVQHEVAEAVLAHAVGGTVSLAYQRGNYFEQRIQVMQKWADYLTGKQSSDTNVDPLATAIATLRDTGLSIEEIVARLNGDNVVRLSRDVA